MEVDTVHNGGYGESVGPAGSADPQGPQDLQRSGGYGSRGGALAVAGRVDITAGHRHTGGFLLDIVMI